MTIGGKRGLNIGMGILGADAASSIVGSGVLDPSTYMAAPGYNIQTDPSTMYPEPGYNIQTAGAGTPDYSGQDGTATWMDQANAYFNLLKQTPTGVVQSSDGTTTQSQPVAAGVNISGPLMWTAVAAGFLILMSAIGGKHR